MKCLFLKGLAALAMGLMSVPAMAAPEDFISQSNREFHFEINAIKNLPPDVRRDIAKIVEKRKSAYLRCQGHARACGLACVAKYKRNKKLQALCFKAHTCQATWDRCVDRIQAEYPLDLPKGSGRPVKIAPE